MDAGCSGWEVTEADTTPISEQATAAVWVLGYWNRQDYLVVSIQIKLARKVEKKDRGVWDHCVVAAPREQAHSDMYLFKSGLCNGCYNIGYFTDRDNQFLPRYGLTIDLNGTEARLLAQGVGRLLVTYNLSIFCFVFLPLGVAV
jgi:hypothetical protein